MAEPLFRRLALIGIGLIGSSVARIAHERGDIAGEVVVTARTPEDARPGAGTLGFADRVESDPARAVAGADCVMLCAPVGAFADIAAAIAPHLAPGRDPDRRRLDQAIGDPRRRPAGAGAACTSCRRTRWPAPNIPGPMPASPRCSRAAGRC